MHQYLIPANSKRSMLILGLFTVVDLIIFGVGALITFVLILTYNAQNLKDILLVLTPLLISSVMVLPVPNHRNIWQLTANVYNYLSNRRTYYWRGWCMLYENENEEGNK